ncbi:MAG: YetF domain-containing protein [Candidatus Saccharibacteria bacterium]
MSEEINVVLRSGFAFITMLVFTRILGKKTVGQLTTFDYIIGITIGSIAANLSTMPAERVLPQWLGLGVWVGLALIFEWVGLKNRTLARVMDGEPTILVKNGKILEKNMAANRYKLSDLTEQLRLKGAFELKDIEYAILETDGEISVLKKTQVEPVTPQDMQIPTKYKGVPAEVIQEGKIIEQSLQRLKLSREWLMHEIEKQGIHNIGEIVYASLDTDGTLYIDRYDDDLRSKFKKQ